MRSYIILRVSEFWGLNAGRWGSMGNNQSRHIWLENSHIYLKIILNIQQMFNNFRQFHRQNNRIYFVVKEKYG